jgi:hypothetical protein
MAHQPRDVRTLLILPRKQGAEEIRVKLCEIQTPEGPRQFVDLRTYAPTDRGVLGPTSHGVRIQSREIDELINALDVALEEISHAKFTVRPKNE